MSSSSPLLLITGASGFIGSHVVQQALSAGYSVRATARPAKVDALKARYAGKIDVVGIADITSDDYTEALKGVHAIIHLAAPLPGKAEPAEALETTINGALNILRQAANMGVKKAVFTGSLSAVADAESNPDLVYSDAILTADYWNPATKEEVLEGNHGIFFNYSASKALAERKIWKFADEHPEIDVTTINPPYNYGPFAPGSVFAKGDFAAFATVLLFYLAVLPSDPSSIELTPGRQADFPIFVDVRDVARAHILALKAPPTSQVGRKRMLFCGASVTWWEVVKHLREVRPELKDRMPRVAEGTQTVEIATADNSRAKEVLGLELTDWRKTVEDTLDCLIEIEKSWANSD